MEKYICTKCGSEDILVRAWINPKKDTIDSWDDSICYCNKCEEVTTYDIINE